MFYKINTDEEELLTDIFSGLLPHENFDKELATQALRELDEVIRMEELYGIYFCIWKLIKNLNLVELYGRKIDNPLKRNCFEVAVQLETSSLLTNSGFDSSLYFSNCGKSFNLTIPLEYQNACDFVYSSLMEKYDQMYAKKVPTKEIFSTIKLLGNSLKKNLASQIVRLSAQIISESGEDVYYNGKSYKGFEDWKLFQYTTLGELNNRFRNVAVSASSKYYTLGTYESYLRFQSENKLMFKPIYSMGFTPITQPVYTQDIITIVADEGTGKTRLAVDQAYRAITTGKNVLYMCGETLMSKIVLAVEARHIWTLNKLQFPLDVLAGVSKFAFEGLSEDEARAKYEEFQGIINNARIDLYDNPNYGKLTVVQMMNYPDFYESIRKYNNELDLDLVIIDHVGALGEESSEVQLSFNRPRSKDERGNVSSLYKNESLLVKDCMLAFLNLSHTSSEANARLRANKDPGNRIGAISSAVTKYSSYVYLLYTTDALKRIDSVILQQKKVRDWAPIFEPMVLTRRGTSDCHEYIEGEQRLLNKSDLNNEEIEDLLD